MYMVLSNIFGDYKDAITSVADNLRSYTSPTPDRLQQPRSSQLNMPQLPYRTSQPTKTVNSTPFLSRSVGSALNRPQLYGGRRGSFGFRPTNSNMPLYSLNSALGQKFSLTSGLKPTAPPASTGSGIVDYSGKLAGTQPYTDVMKRVSTESGVPWEVLMAIMGLESGGQNLAANGAGAVGLMQIVPLYWQDTANKFGGNLMDP